MAHQGGVCPVVEDGSARIDNAGEYALEQYSDETGAGWWNLGVIAIEAATKAFAAANEAHALSIDPDAVGSMVKKLTIMQDKLTEAATRSMQIGYGTRLGGGYAQEVGNINKELGRYVY